jgi:hypothetical protein
MDEDELCAPSWVETYSYGSVRYVKKHHDKGGFDYFVEEAKDE